MFIHQGQFTGPSSNRAGCRATSVITSYHHIISQNLSGALFTLSVVIEALTTTSNH